MKRVIILGAGSSRVRRSHLVGDPTNGTWDGFEVTTLDNEPSHKTDIVHDLNVLPWPLPSDTYDRVEAYEILEHLGRQGDAASFFGHFSEIYRIMKVGGMLSATCPSYRSSWAWGDPSHTRVITSGSLAFLDRSEYEKQVGKTAMSDFRSIWHGDFKRIFIEENDDELRFILEKR